MIEGQGSKSFDLAKSFCFSQPELAHQILQMITDTTINYLEAQVRAGADLLQLFDSWAGLLSPDDFEKYSLPYCKQIIAALKDQTLTILFARGAFGSIEAMSGPEQMRWALTGASGLPWPGNWPDRKWYYRKF
jgi:uroporphyrinogen decarboxylase